jgi:hypothetical protein
MADAFTSPQHIARLNIEHFSRLLQTPLDERTRTTVERLLAEEKAKLENLPKVTTPCGSRAGGKAHR